ncbi:homing endonuclease associated repeat-containing protein [Haladaptatus halobius]|uniref:homing endonuclease associated repeat-containing protein n=1 Tax=Haladaptatus halobius TaxID=2884875 RepID=UPI001D09F88E|nr:hypothetical protein [Haladaptatus halobius]
MATWWFVSISSVIHPFDSSGENLNKIVEIGNSDYTMASKLSAKELLAELLEFAEELGTTPTRAQMDEREPYSSTPYYTEFGSGNTALEAAGLVTNHDNSIPKNELIRALQKLADKSDRLPRF